VNWLRGPLIGTAGLVVVIGILVALDAFAPSRPARASPENWLLGASILLMFSAAALALGNSPAAALAARLIVQVSSAGGCYLGLAMMTFVGPSSFTDLRSLCSLAGLFLLVTYCLATFAAATLPLARLRHVWRCRYYLHFGIFPAACFALSVFISDDSFRYAECAVNLMLGIPFILLNFRMYHLRERFDAGAKTSP
jgi:hypothetical protein